MQSLQQHRESGMGQEEGIASRIRRGLDHYAEFGAEIVEQNGAYEIPSASHTGFRHYVRLAETSEHCTCKDYATNGFGVCRHTAAALIYEAKRPTYRVEEGRYHDHLRGREYRVNEIRLGEFVRCVGVYSSEAEAYGLLAELTSAKRAA